MRLVRPSPAARIPTVVLLLLACGAPEGGQRAGQVGDAPVGAVPEPDATAAAGAVPDPAAQVRAAMQGAPADIVALLLAWDTADLRFAPRYEEALRAAWCLGAGSACGGDELAGEDLVVVDGYQVETTFAGPDSAQLVVTHDGLGTVWPGGIDEGAGTPPVTLTLRRRASGWAVVAVEPPLARHLSRTALLRRYTGVAPDSVMLARWLRDR